MSQEQRDSLCICGAFHQINKVKEIRANSLNAKLAPHFYKAYVFKSKWHLIFYTYCTIILIESIHTPCLPSLGALSICLFAEELIIEAEGFSPQGNMS